MEPNKPNQKNCKLRQHHTNQTPHALTRTGALLTLSLTTTLTTTLTLAPSNAQAKPVAHPAAMQAAKNHSGSFQAIQSAHSAVPRSTLYRYLNKNGWDAPQTDQEKLIVAARIEADALHLDFHTLQNKFPGLGRSTIYRLLSNKNGKWPLNRTEYAEARKKEQENFVIGGRPPLEQLLKQQGITLNSNQYASWDGKYNENGDPIYNAAPKDVAIHNMQKHGKPLNRVAYWDEVETQRKKGTLNYTTLTAQKSRENWTIGGRPPLEDLLRQQGLKGKHFEWRGEYNAAGDPIFYDAEYPQSYNPRDPISIHYVQSTHNVSSNIVKYSPTKPPILNREELKNQAIAQAEAARKAQEHWAIGGRPPLLELLKQQGLSNPPSGAMVAWTGAYNQLGDPIYGLWDGKGNKPKNHGTPLNREEVKNRDIARAEADRKYKEHWAVDGRPPLEELLKMQGIDLKPNIQAVWMGDYNQQGDPIYGISFNTIPQKNKPTLNRREVAEKRAAEAKHWAVGGRPPLAELLQQQGLPPGQEKNAVWTGLYNQVGDPLYLHKDHPNLKNAGHLPKSKPLNREQVANARLAENAALKKAEEHWRDSGRPPIGDLIKQQGLEGKNPYWDGVSYTQEGDPRFQAGYVATIPTPTPPPPSRPPQIPKPCRYAIAYSNQGMSCSCPQCHTANQWARELSKGNPWPPGQNPYTYTR